MISKTTWNQLKIWWIRLLPNLDQQMSTLSASKSVYRSFKRKSRRLRLMQLKRRKQKNPHNRRLPCSRSKCSNNSRYRLPSSQLRHHNRSLLMARSPTNNCNILVLWRHVLLSTWMLSTIAKTLSRTPLSFPSCYRKLRTWRNWTKSSLMVEIWQRRMSKVSSLSVVPIYSVMMRVSGIKVSTNIHIYDIYRVY